MSETEVIDVEFQEAMKTCFRCRTLKPVSNFRFRSRQNNKRQSYCPTCEADYINELRRKKRGTQPEKLYERDRKSRLKKFGITENEYSILNVSQNGLCAICRKENHKLNDKRIKLAIDHCHTTGKIRGLLCGNCNRALGLFKDNPKLLKNAILYLNGGCNE